MLLIGYENHKVELYVNVRKENERRQFELFHTLVGHEDWIRDIDVCQPSHTQLFIATSSQDHYIRLWRLDSAPTKQEHEIRQVVDEDTVDDEDEQDTDAAKIDDELKLKRY